MTGEKQIPAAKLHVLKLGPIKTKMGDKWARLSGLVHKLFEKTLRQIQGPEDHFLLVDEMSYVVTFHNLSEEEASLACASIAKEVCELLFGADIDDIGVRSLVGMVSSVAFELGPESGAKIADLLERTGGEIIVRHGDDPGMAWRAGEKLGPAPKGAWQPGDWIARAHEAAGQAGWDMGLFPIWDLHKRKSFSLQVALYSGGLQKLPVPVRRALGGTQDARIAEMEVSLLYAAAAYGHRVHAAQKIGALGVGVSYETMSGFHTRIRYIGALKAVKVLAECPLLVCIEQVPDGTPLGRLAEMVAMMSVPNVRVSLDFKTLRTLPDIDIRLGAAGMGGALPGDADGAAAALIAQRLVRRATDQKAFTFLHGLNSLALLGAAHEAGVRLGSGTAIGTGQHFSGLEAVPDIPLTAENSQWAV